MLNWILQTWITIAVLMIGLEWLQRKRRVSPVLAHSLWCVLLLKSVAPPVLVWPVAIPMGEATSPIAMVESIPENLNTSLVPSQARVEFTEQSIHRMAKPLSETEIAKSTSLTAVGTAKELVEEPGLPDTPSHVGLNISAVVGWTPVALIGLWLTGSSLTLLVEIFRIIRFNRFVRRGTTDRELDEEIQTIAQSMGLRSVRHLVVKGIQTPFVWSMGRAILVWPSSLLSSLSNDARRALIAHELAHIKRHDHWIAWLELLSNVVWWWNPIQWRLRNNLRNAAEQVCDAYAIHHAQISQRAYAETLLTICQSQMQSTACSSVLAATHSDRRVLEDRMRRLYDKPRSIQQTKLGLTVALLTASITLPVWAQQQANKSEPAPKAPVATIATNTAIEPNKAIDTNVKPLRPTFVDSGVRPEEMPTDWVFPELIVPSSQYALTPVSVKGKVVESDAKARPVEGAVVSLMNGSLALAVTRSDSAGNFEFKKLPVFGNAPLQLVAIHSQKGLGMAELHSGLGLVDLHKFVQSHSKPLVREQSEVDLGHHFIPLHEFRESQGTVLDSNRRPITNATVSLQIGPLGYSPSTDLETMCARVITDREGNFKFVAAPRVHAMEVAIAHPDWPTTTWQLPPDLSNQYQIPKGVRIAGKVHFPQTAHNPTASITVGNRHGTRTQADGTFSILIDEKLVGGNARVTCYPICDNLLLIPPEPKMLLIKPSGHDVELHAEVGRMVSGVVTGTDGAPVANMRVAWNAMNDIQPPRLPIGSGRFASATNDAGRFNIVIPNIAGELSTYRIKLLVGEKYVDNYGEERSLLDGAMSVRESFQNIPASDTDPNAA